MDDASLTYRIGGIAASCSEPTIAFGRDPERMPGGVPGGAVPVRLLSLANEPIASMSRLVCIVAFDGTSWCLENPATHRRSIIVRYESRAAVDVRPGTFTRLTAPCEVEHSPVAYGPYTFSLDPSPVVDTETNLGVDIEEMFVTRIADPALGLSEWSVLYAHAAYLFDSSVPQRTDQQVATLLGLKTKSVETYMKRIRRKIESSLGPQGVPSLRTPALLTWLVQQGYITRADVERYVSPAGPSKEIAQ